ncbi:hypothetical protein N7462_003841 [Penicillium macrosclerotiorum]|uniref:uncharacterized protein n=1 Tax=Penicillium macrosclerotiorum TaxID=303699 RepID=UPI0025480829|nr:uncharacterized protein N7462_003841 [Penicillium macrosclerotiorum]KAJ5689449.1 hypothetical protein N7462_003841 [Penicillium macrosclerotiorum]
MNPSVERQLTIQHIKSLLIQERYFRDTAQWQNLRNAYHPDASQTSINITWFEGDIDGFVSGSEQMMNGGTRATHSICPVSVHVNGEKAVSESTGSINIRFMVGDCSYDCTSYTRFVSRLQRVDGKWKILTLEAIYERDTIIPVFPTLSNTPFVLNYPRNSYKCIAWILARKGFEINRNLPGIDLPLSVSKLMENSWTWLGRSESSYSG